MSAKHVRESHQIRSIRSVVGAWDISICTETYLCYGNKTLGQACDSFEYGDVDCTVRNCRKEPAEQLELIKNCIVGGGYSLVSTRLEPFSVSEALYDVEFSGDASRHIRSTTGSAQLQDHVI